MEPQQRTASPVPEAILTIFTSPMSYFTSPMSCKFSTASSALVALMFATCASAEFAYTITDLGTLGGPTTLATSINTSGQVAGYSTPGNLSYVAFRYDGSTLSDLGTLGGTYSVANGINDAGHVVGESALGNDFTRHAFIYNGSSMTDLGTLGGTFSSANGINASGQVVGESTTGDNIRRAFLYKGVSMLDLGSSDCAASVATCINGVGQIAGWCTFSGAGYPYRAFLYSGTGMSDLGTLGGVASMALGINASGHVVGFSHTSDGHIHAFLYNGAVMSDLGTLGGNIGGDSSQASGINDAGYVVGQSTADGVDYHAFVYNGSNLIDLNTVTDLNGTTFTTLSAATAVNNSGQIVGYGYTPDGYPHAFRLTPIPPREPVEIPTTTLKVGVDGNTVSFASQTGHLYQLQVSLNVGLDAIVWTNVGARTAGTGTTLVLIAPQVSASKIFYRVVID